MTNIIPHPAFLLNLPFLIAMPNTQKLIKEIKTEVLKWDNTSAGVHKMGGIGFYYNEREFAHIHWNGDLDIIFGSKLTSELLKNNHAQFHKYVPTIAVTFKLKNISETPSAIFLLRLAYLKAIKKASVDSNEMFNLEMELGKLPFNSSIIGLI